MERVILHCDMNNFYASVECLYRPSLRNVPMIVGGDPELRHGIVLAKNNLAKAAGIVTAEPVGQARQKCAGLVSVPPNFDLYFRFSKMAREIYDEYSSQVEPFGLDEAWVDVTGTTRLMGKTGEQIANEIRERIKFEMGITISVGVSFNKIFAKLGSDLKKPDAVTVITKENFRKKLWHLPAMELLYVGAATSEKLKAIGINTIGQLANADVNALCSCVGSWGGVIHRFANGLDDAEVAPMGVEGMIKSIGNSTTTPRDLTTPDDVRIMLYVLAESVASRLRDSGLECRTVQISLRDNALVGCERQAKVERPTCLASEIANKAFDIFTDKYKFAKPLRHIGVRASDLVPCERDEQLTVFIDDEEKRRRRHGLERSIDWLRERYGYFAVFRAIVASDPTIGAINPKDDHKVFPVSYF